MAALTKERGMFELTLLNAEVSQAEMDDVLVFGLNRGIPPEIMTRLESLWRVTKTIAGQVVAVGKIVVLKIFEFLKANPNLTIGIALGAAVGVLIAGIPLLGTLLAPLSTALSMAYGATVGAAFDAGGIPSDPYIAASHLAKKFFELIQEIFMAVKDYLVMVEA
ncbi:MULTISPECIES: hypothetical protein [Pseudomonas]|uniref:hypothetical protein n=1 Tax=Pseudomonas TaxID=286 RepID=UPI000B48B5B7|nr:MULTISPECIES: hypothetical protein [Pseudomonas]MCU9100520.1 hypothetical protein [Pseudomonas aeruginosa]MCU9249850.1 hypothetical protein [Pseudomonas aeruginosa]MCU9301162.1 hypothetical protein [Pseudomonas aeruginosa]MCU9506672.1 hypothetical protein [Pseudomonas aeruginosa]MDG1580584.1 hypothetical protein [Pseudomonas sp. GOM6]